MKNETSRPGIIGPLAAAVLFGVFLIAAPPGLSQTVALTPPNPAGSYPAPGQLIDVGGYRIHLDCTGKGNPTVVMASGLGDYSFDWSLVQPLVARSSRVCTYDRAGYAWSEPDPKPRSLQRAVDELHTVLHNARIGGPYILVGHSWGGLIVRVFASVYAEETAGMVLVDSSHEDRLEVVNGKRIRARLLTHAELHDLFEAERKADQLRAISAKSPKPEIAPKTFVPKVQPPYDKLPPEIQELRIWARSKGRVADVSDYQEPLLLVHATRTDRRFPFGEMPLIVLSRGINDFSDDQGVSAAEFFADHRKRQAHLATLSRNTKQIIARKSGHHIPLDQPELVVAAVDQILNAVRHHVR